jgi:hypothetical protein
MMAPPKQILHPWLAHLQGLTAIIKAQNYNAEISVPNLDSSGLVDGPLNKMGLPSTELSELDGRCIGTADHKQRTLHHEIATAQLTLERSPAANSHSISASLDSLIVQTEPILQMAGTLFENPHSITEERFAYLFDAVRLQLSIVRDWPLFLPSEWKPKTIRHHIESPPSAQLEMFPGKFDVYPNRE